jgi:type VI secretion system protein ImpL
MIERLHAERDRSRRAAVLSFPQQLGAFREIARQFVEGALGRHEYGSTPLLRGAYLSSGTQEGAPIDRMLTAVARTFGVDAARVQAGTGQRRTYFVERLLKDVLFRESGLAGTSPRFERQKLLVQAAAYAGIALITVLLVASFATSYARNRVFVAEVQGTLKDLPGTETLSGAPDINSYFARALARLEVISDTQDVAGQYREHIPLLMRFGLSQAYALFAQTHGAYLRELDATLLPGVGVRFRQGLSESASDPQALYGYLKGYLMLGQPQHLDPAELAALARLEWQRLFPQDPAISKALDKHFSARLDDPQKPRALSLDNALIDQARATLKTADVATLIYGSVQVEATRSGASPVRLGESLGLLGNVFNRKSGTPLSQPLPVLFSRPYFASEVDGGIGESVDLFVKDYWVFDTGRVDPLARSRYEQQVLTLYQQDYIKKWDALLADLKLQPVTSIQAASALAAKLSGPSSPLKALLNLVRDNTSDLLRAPPGEAAGVSSGASDLGAVTLRAKKVGENIAARRALNTRLAGELRADGVTSGTGDAANEANGTNGTNGAVNAGASQPGAVIEEHFASINQLSVGAPGSTPLDHTLGVLDQLSKTLLTMNDLSSPAAQNNPALLAARQEAEQLPPQAAGLIAGLTGKSADLVASGSSAALADQFHAAGGNDCAGFVDGRYPFVSAGGSDIPLQNFADLFGNGGRFDSFFKATLSQRVDTGGHTWRWKAGAPSGPDSVLTGAQIADDIRQIYFRNGAQVQVGFTLLAPQLDSPVARVVVEIDGQKFDYSANGAAGTTSAASAASTTSAAMTWPGPQPGHVVITAFDEANHPLGAPLRFDGDWAFFHALDAGHLQKQGDVRFMASFDFDGHTVKLPIQPASLKNPFLNDEVRRFRCPR